MSRVDAGGLAARHPAAVRALAPTSLAGLALITVATAAWAAWTDADLLAAGASLFDWPRAAMVALLYLGAHVLRIGRMLVLLGNTARSVRAVAVAHAITAPVSGLTPFKVGEIVRIHAFGVASEGFVHGLRAVWIERTLDAAVLAAAGLVALSALPALGETVLPITIVALGVLLATAIAITVLPENVGMAKAWLIRRYTSSWSLTALRLLHDLGRGLRRSQELVRHKLATLVALTLALWALETAALTLLVGVVDVATVLGGILAVLSGLVRPGQALVGAVGAQIPVHRLVVFGTVNAFAAVALIAVVLRPRSGRAILDAR